MSGDTPKRDIKAVNRKPKQPSTDGDTSVVLRNPQNKISHAEKENSKAIVGTLLSIGYSVTDVSKETGIQPSTILKWLKSGELTLDTTLLSDVRDMIKLSYMIKAGEFANVALEKLTEQARSGSLYGKDLAIALGIISDKMETINSLGCQPSKNSTTIGVGISFEGIVSIPDEPIVVTDSD